MPPQQVHLENVLLLRQLVAELADDLIVPILRQVGVKIGLLVQTRRELVTLDGVGVNVQLTG